MPGLCGCEASECVTVDELSALPGFYFPGERERERDIDKESKREPPGGVWSPV